MIILLDIELPVLLLIGFLLCVFSGGFLSFVCVVLLFVFACLGVLVFLVCLVFCFVGFSFFYYAYVPAYSVWSSCSSSSYYYSDLARFVFFLLICVFHNSSYCY